MKPILFNTEMVEAILEGRKTVTRRAIKPRYRDDEVGFQVITTKSGEFIRVEKIDENECGIFPDGTERYVHPPYQPGDSLWVRETWMQEGDVFRYKAGFYDKERRWRPSIHMPKEAARLFLQVKDVRVEQLQDINLAPPGPESPVIKEGFKHTSDFIAAWEKTIRRSDRSVYGWEANPWVWVIEFERITREEASI